MEVAEIAGPGVLKARSGDAPLCQGRCRQATRPTGAPPGLSVIWAAYCAVSTTRERHTGFPCPKLGPGVCRFARQCDPDAESRLPALEGTPEPDVNIEPLPAEGNVTSVSRPTPSGPRPALADVIPLQPNNFIFVFWRTALAKKSDNSASSSPPPSPGRKPVISPGTRMLTNSELRWLRQRAAESATYGRKAFSPLRPEEDGQLSAAEPAAFTPEFVRDAGRLSKG